MADEHVERVRRQRRVVSPHALVDEAAREHLARMAEEELEQLELDPAELDLAATALRVARQQVELEVGERERLDAFAGTTQQARTRATSSSFANGFTR